MKQRKWLVAVLVGTLLVNGIGYALFRMKKGDEPQPATVASTGPGGTQTTRAAAPINVDPNADVVRARRAAGLAALESGDYDTAVDQFTQAARLSDQGDIAELLRIATDMKTRRSAKGTPAAASTETASAPTPDAAPSAPVATKTVVEDTQRAAAPSATSGSSNRDSKRNVKVATRSRPPPSKPSSASRTPSVEEEVPAVDSSAPRQGLLLVTSTPPGMVVQVDGKTLDLTPARVNVRAGPHHVVLVYNERRVLDETVDVTEDGVRSVNKELAPEVPAVAASSTPVAPRPVPQAQTAVGASAPPSSNQNPAAQTPPRPTATAASTAKTGDLVVNSPGLYGEVWINDRPYGFPPVTAAGLPVGKARVEIRIHGEVKKTLTAEVLPAQLNTIRVR